MKHAMFAVAALLVLSGPALADDYLQADPKSFDLEGAKRIRIEFPVGHLTLTGDEGTNVRVQVRVECKGADTDECAEEAGRVRLDHAVANGSFRLEFSGIRKDWAGHHITVIANVIVPSTLIAELNMGVGQADVVDMRRDLDVELGVGELKVRGSQADFHDAEAESGVGDASIQTRDGRVRERGFIGHSARWTEGSGSSSIRAHVGVGESSVTLR